MKRRSIACSTAWRSFGLFWKSGCVVVQVDAPDQEVLVDHEAALVDAVLVGELLGLSGREAARVGLVVLALQAMRRQVAADAAERDAVDVVLEAERLQRLLVVLPVRVPHGQRGRLLVPLLEEYGPAETEALVDLGVERVARGHGREERHRDAAAGSPGATFFRLMTSVRAFARPTLATSSRNDDAGDCSFAFFARSNARLKFADVTAAVRELEALLDGDRVALAAVRDPRQALRRHRREPLARGPGDVRVAVHAQLRRAHQFHECVK